MSIETAERVFQVADEYRLGLLSRFDEFSPTPWFAQTGYQGKWWVLYQLPNEYRMEIYRLLTKAGLIGYRRRVALAMESRGKYFSAGGNADPESDPERWAAGWMSVVIKASGLAPVVRNKVMLPIFKASDDESERERLRAIALDIGWYPCVKVA
jgi:hypothetical protein